MAAKVDDLYLLIVLDVQVEVRSGNPHDSDERAEPIASDRLGALKSLEVEAYFGLMG
jgi:hypothetical protein